MPRKRLPKPSATIQPLADAVTALAKIGARLQEIETERLALEAAHKEAIELLLTATRRAAGEPAMFAAAKRSDAAPAAEPKRGPGRPPKATNATPTPGE